MVPEKLNSFLDFACFVPLFEDMTLYELEIIFQTLDWTTVKKDTYIVQEDMLNEKLFYFIASGQVKVVATNEGGKEKIYSMLHVGNTFGEMSLLDSRPRSASVIALTDCEFYTLTSIAFFRLLELFPKISIALLRDFTGRLRDVNQQMVNTAFMLTTDRIRKYLLNLASLRGKRNRQGNLLINDIPSQTTISQLLGCSRETVSREMQILKDEKIIKRMKNKRLVILNEKALQV